MISQDNKKIKNLFDAFLLLKTREEVSDFCKDLMTEAEITELASRWEVAKALDSGKSQRAVSSETGVSIATVTRVNQWLNRGMGGYRLLLDRLASTSSKKKTSSAAHKHPR